MHQMNQSPLSSPQECGHNGIEQSFIKKETKTPASVFVELQHEQSELTNESKFKRKLEMQNESDSDEVDESMEKEAIRDNFCDGIKEQNLEVLLGPAEDWKIKANDPQAYHETRSP